MTNAIDDDGVEIPPPNPEKFKVTIMQLKNNKGAGPDDHMHQLIYKLWLEESMPNDIRQLQEYKPSPYRI